MKTVTLTARELAVISVTLGIALKGLERVPDLPFTTKELLAIGQKLMIDDPEIEQREAERIMNDMGWRTEQA